MTSTRRNWLPITIVALLAALVAIMAMISTAQPAKAAAGEVVMLDTTLHSSLGGGRTELGAAYNLVGKNIVLKTPAQWGAMTTADFAAFDAIVLGDPTCKTGTAPISAAIANASTWGAAVTGNVILIGTDEQFHSFPSQGGTQVMEGAAAFSVAEAGKTGAYVSLSCYYHGASAGTALPMLDNAFGAAGDFTATGVGCFNKAHIVATHPALTGITDATLSNWSCSVHEAFDNWPITFEVLAIAQGIGSVFTAPDGTVGTPYILARGVTVISDIDLEPTSDTNFLGDKHTLTAKVTIDDPVPGTPVVGTDVTFEIIAGPHTGVIGTAKTNASGVATISYVGTAVGIDTIQATFVDADGKTQRSNRVTKTWEEKPIEIDLTPDVAVNDLGLSPDHTVTATVLLGGAPLAGAVVEFTVVGVSGPVGGSVVTDAAGQATYTYPGVALGLDTITACVEGDVCDEVSKEWVDRTPPLTSCAESVNPSGKNVPSAPGKGGQGQNQDGFYEVSAADVVDLDPAVFVVDMGTDNVFGTGDDSTFGPFSSPTNIKYTEANGATPNIKPGSGDVDWKINGQGDAAVFAVDFSGNMSTVQHCLVPPDPK